MIEVREWNYEGSGYLTTGDSCLARNLEDDLRLGRWLARDEVSADSDSLAVGVERAEQLNSRQQPIDGEGTK